MELLFLQSLPLAHEVKSLKVKRARVAEAASWLEPPLELPDELYAGMTDHGVIRDRTAEFNWTIWDHLKWLCRFVQHVAQRPAGRRRGGRQGSAGLPPAGGRHPR